MSQDNNSYLIQEEQEETINIRELLDKYLIHWKWFVVSAILAVAVALIYLKTKNPVYESHAVLLIKNDKEGSGSIGELSVFKDLGLGGGSANLANEIEILHSRKLAAAVVRSLELNIRYYNSTNGFRNSLYFENSPVLVSAVSNPEYLLKRSADFELQTTGSNTFTLKNKKLNTSYTGSFGKVLDTKIGRLVFSKSNTFKPGEKLQLKIEIIPLETCVTNLLKNLTVESANKEADVLNISYKGSNMDENNAIINELIHQHEIEAINDKNEIAMNTSKFINDRMKFISMELSDVEEEGQQFKTQHKLVDVTSDAAVFLEKESETDKEITKTTIQISLASYMNDYIKAYSGTDVLLPSNIGLEDQSVAEMVVEYNKLVLERGKLLKSTGEKYPGIQKIDGQLVEMKASLVASLQNVKRTLELQLKKLTAQEQLYQSKIASIPQYEREYRDIIRQQQIKETLYVYLLQKREENEITLAATVGNTKSIDMAYTDGIPVSPKKKVILLAALLLGIVLPVSVIYVNDLLDNKVHGAKDLQGNGISLIGEIPQVKNESDEIILNDTNNMLSEAFRMVRTNLNFLINKPAGESKVILVTSTIAGEGKTHSSILLANSLSLTGKKTVVVGMDLRKPKINQYLKIEKFYGVSNYIINDKLELKDLLNPVNEHLDVIISGDIPPNPSELLMRDRLNQLVAELKEHYEYIIIDTAPVGLVSDVLLLSGLADATIYVVRANYLDKRMLPLSLALHKDKKMKNMAYLINGINLKRNAYGYGYNGYGYGYGYSGESTEKSRFSFLKRTKK